MSVHWALVHPILVHVNRVDLVYHSAKVDTVQWSPVNLVGQDSTKSVYSTISSLLYNTVVNSIKRNLNKNVGSSDEKKNENRIVNT